MIKKYEILLYLIFLIVVYFLCFGEILLTSDILSGSDFYVPHQIEDHLNMANYLWYPASTGFYNYYSISSWPSFILSGAVRLVLKDNILLSQKLLFLSPLMASISMLILLWNGLKIKNYMSLVGSIIYAYGPISLAFYGSFFLWELVFLPLVIHYTIDFFYEEKNESLIKLVLVLALIPEKHTFVILPFIVFSTVIIKILTKPSLRDRFHIFIKSFLFVIIFLFLLILVRPTLIIPLYAKITSSAITETSELSPHLTSFTFLDMNEIWTLSNIFRERYVKTAYIPLGFLVPLFALFSLISLKKMDLKQRGKIFIIVILFFMVLTFFIILKYCGDYPIISNFINLIPLRTRHAPQMFFWCFSSILFSLGLNNLAKIISENFLKSPKSSDYSVSIIHNKFKINTLFPILLLCLILVGAFFIYCPIYTREAHLAGQPKRDFVESTNPYYEIFSPTLLEKYNSNDFSTVPNYYILLRDTIYSIRNDTRVIVIPTTRSVQSCYASHDGILWFNTYVSPETNELTLISIKEFKDSLSNPDELEYSLRLFSLFNVKYFALLLNETLEAGATYNQQLWHNQPRNIEEQSWAWQWGLLVGDPQIYLRYFLSKDDFSLIISNDSYVIFNYK
jgi:hypothetical protein